MNGLVIVGCDEVNHVKIGMLLDVLLPTLYRVHGTLPFLHACFNVETLFNSIKYTIEAKYEIKIC